MELGFKLALPLSLKLDTGHKFLFHEFLWAQECSWRDGRKEFTWGKKKINLQELSVLVLGFFIPKLILSKL